MVGKVIISLVWVFWILAMSTVEGQDLSAVSQDDYDSLHAEVAIGLRSRHTLRVLQLRLLSAGPCDREGLGQELRVVRSPAGTETDGCERDADREDPRGGTGRG